MLALHRFNRQVLSSASMSKQESGKGLKSAYEAALERLERQGIERPRQEALSDQIRQEMAEIRNRAEAELAQLEIMHRQRLGRTDALARHQELEDYRRERQRIEDQRDEKLLRLREGR